MRGAHGETERIPVRAEDTTYHRPPIVNTRNLQILRFDQQFIPFQIYQELQDSAHAIEASTMGPQRRWLSQRSTYFRPETCRGSGQNAEQHMRLDDDYRASGVH